MSTYRFGTKKCHAMVQIVDDYFDAPTFDGQEIGPYIIEFGTPEDGNQALLKLHENGGEDLITLEQREHVPTGTTHTARSDDGKEWQVPDVRVERAIITLPAHAITRFTEVVA